MDWVKRMNSVLDYIEQNLDGEIDKKIIASIFASSQGDFEKVFVNVTDMTLSEYIRKRRLTCAAVEIKISNTKIIDVAVKYGYNSAVSFSYAFKKFHGINPSELKNSDALPLSFRPFVFNNILSEKGVDTMPYYSIENAEYLMQKIVNKKHAMKFIRTVSEHNGVKCACDSHRAAVMLPEGVNDWDLSNAYFDTGDLKSPRFALSRIFNSRDNDSLLFKLSKRQAASLLVSFDGAKIDYESKYISLSASRKNNKSQEAIVFVNINTMGIITEVSALELKSNDSEPIIGFNIKLIEESLKFVMCSDDENIDIYYSGRVAPLIMKSGRFYTAVLPIKYKDDPPIKFKDDIA